MNVGKNLSILVKRRVLSFDSIAMSCLERPHWLGNMVLSKWGDSEVLIHEQVDDRWQKMETHLFTLGG